MMDLSVLFAASLKLWLLESFLSPRRRVPWRWLCQCACRYGVGFHGKDEADLAGVWRAAITSSVERLLVSCAAFTEVSETTIKIPAPV